jgi:hypothetical protein
MLPLHITEPADIIKTENMIGMRMGYENRINPLHAERQHLIAQIRRSIKQQGLPASLNIQTAAVAFIFGVIRLTDSTTASNHWNTMRSTRTEKRDFHDNRLTSKALDCTSNLMWVRQGRASVPLAKTSETLVLR